MRGGPRWRDRSHRWVDVNDPRSCILRTDSLHTDAGADGAGTSATRVAHTRLTETRSQKRCVATRVIDHGGRVGRYRTAFTGLIPGWQTDHREQPRFPGGSVATPSG